MKNTLAISFSKNHCYLTQLTQEKENRSLTDVTSFFYEDNLLDALRININAMKPLISKSTRVVLILPSQAALLKNITVDSALTDEEIIYHIKSQSFTLFGYMSEQLCFDYETLFVEENRRGIIIAAAHQQKIKTYQNYFNELKIPLDVIDIDIFSLIGLTLPLINEKDFILLFDHEDYLLVIVTRNKKPQKSDTIDLSSSEALAQLDSFLSINEKMFVITDNPQLKTCLDKLNFSYQALDTPSFFDFIIKNKSGTPNCMLNPFLISISAGLRGD